MIGLAHRMELHLGPGGHGSRFGTILDTLGDVIELAALWCPGQKSNLRPVRHNIGGHAASLDYSMDSRILDDMLTHHIRGIHKQSGRIEGVASLLRRGSRMGGHPGPYKLQPIQGNKIDINEICPSHMHHDGKIIGIENSLICHDTFCAVDFFIRSADDIHPEGQLLFYGVQSQGGQHAGAAAGTVAAGMTHCYANIFVN